MPMGWCGLLRARPVWLLVCALGLLQSCSFKREDHPQFCDSNADCDGDQSCVESFCVSEGLSAADGGTRPRDGGGGAGSGGDDSGAGSPCPEGQEPEPCYGGSAETEDVGECRGGERVCVGGVFTQCLGQVLPGDEDCNEKDDDCDGMTDETVDGNCETGMNGVCNEGLLVCRGAYRVCEPATQPSIETCNGKDDDCDNEIDEVDQSECFPPGASGCTKPEPTAPFMCLGLCHPGYIGCNGGQGQCVDPVTAGTEECTSGGGTAADEDCDLNVDEGCPCSPGENRPCYSGADGTQGNPPCRAGMQQCVGGYWGACEGQVMPGTETCLNPNVDDDCDGMRDDVPNLGRPCEDPGMPYGICHEGIYQCEGQSEHVVCVTPDPMMELCDPIDQDCDNDPYNGFDLNNNNQHCGMCNNACTNGQTCCQGRCMSAAEFAMDSANCGGCGIACGAGQACCWGDCIVDTRGGQGAGGGYSAIVIPPPPGGFCACPSDCGDQTCCGDQCVDLTKDNYNCGYCGNDCTRGTIFQSCCNGYCALTCVDPQG